MRRQAIAILILLVIPIVSATVGGAGQFPLPISETAAAWAGTRAIIVGGTTFDPFNGITETRNVWRFTPPSSTSDCGDTIQSLRFTSAVFDGSKVYAFGGQGQYGPDSASVYRIDPNSCASEVAGTMPQTRQMAAAVYAPAFGEAYVIGGQRSTILAYRPSSGAMQEVASLPRALSGSSAAWDPTTARAYVFGGGDYGSESPDILAFDPATREVKDTGFDLPTARWGSCAMWMGGAAYVFGGSQGSARFSDVVRFVPGRAPTVVEQLPVPRAWCSAATDGTRAWIFGGQSGCCSSTLVAEILRFEPSIPPSEPTSVAATPGPAGRILLAWDPPIDPGTGALVRYEVWHGPSGGAPSPIVNVGATRSFTHDWLTDAAWLHGNASFGYRVRAVTTVGPGPWSAEARCSPPATLLGPAAMCKAAPVEELEIHVPARTQEVGTSAFGPAPATSASLEWGGGTVTVDAGSTSEPLSIERGRSSLTVKVGEAGFDAFLP